VNNINNTVMEIVSELIDIKNPPKDNHGYYGIVLKPKYMPLWLAKLLKNKLKVREGWLNMPYSHAKPKRNWDERWWFDYSKGREHSVQCQPIYWCKIKTYYNVRVIPSSKHPFNWKVEDPQGSYRIAE